MPRSRFSGVAIAAAALVLCVALPAHGTSPPPLRDAPQAPACFDADTPEAKWLKGTGLPVHLAIANHLQRLLRGHGEPSVEFACEGADFSYRGKATKEGATVESRYKPQGKPHASEAYLAAARHGITRAAWPNGKPQYVEYWCHGQPVGFHRYFDNTGQLTAIADHSSSDYRVQRNRRGGRTYVTEGGSSTGGPAPIGYGPILVRKLYPVQRGQVGDAVLQWGHGTSGYESLDPATKLEQWVTGGNQGWIRASGSRLMLINAPMDYTPFWDVYQRDRQQLSGADPVIPYDKEILTCPWLDEAMTPPLQRAVLALPAVKPLTEAELKATPRARYLACVNQPTSACLLEFGLGQIGNEPHRDTFLLGAAAAALRVRRPDVALQAMERIFEREMSFNRPNPYFAVPEMVRAEAALQQGNQARADQHAHRAFAHAERVVQAHEVQHTMRALAAVGPMLARLGWVDLAARTHDKLASARDARAFETLGAVGLAHAHAGRAAEARLAASQLRTRPDRLLPEAERDGKSGWYSPRTGYARALAAIAQRLAQQGEQDQALGLVGQAESELAKAPASAEGRSDAHEALAVAHARLGNVTQVGVHLAATSVYQRLRVQAQAAIGLCESGRAQEGHAILAAMQGALSKQVTARSASPIALLAATTVRCARLPEGRALFEEAKTHVDATPGCSGDVCGGFRESAGDALANALLEAGELDLLARWSSTLWMDARTHTAWAVRQAGSGDAAGAAQRLAEVQARPAPSLTPLQRVRLLVAWGHVDMVAGRAALPRLEEAFAAARAIDQPVVRGEALLAAARAFTAAGVRARSLTALRAARASFDATLALDNAPGMYYGSASRQLADVAQEFLAAGSADEARRTAEGFLLPRGSTFARERATVYANSIDAALLSQPDAPSGLEQRLAALDQLPASLVKAEALDLLWRSAQGSHPPAAVKAHAQLQLQRSGEYFVEVASSAERRRMIGLFAGWLRDGPAEVQREQHLKRLVDEARRLDTAWQARAICELGYTAGVLGLPNARSLLDEGRGVAKRKERQTFPLDPSPVGACAYWLRRSGDSEGASALMTQAAEPLRATANRSQGVGLPPYAGDLLALSIAVFEAEQGEIPVDWLNGYWRP